MPTRRAEVEFKKYRATNLESGSTKEFTSSHMGRNPGLRAITVLLVNCDYITVHNDNGSYKWEAVADD